MRVECLGDWPGERMNFLDSYPALRLTAPRDVHRMRILRQCLAGLVRDQVCRTALSRCWVPGHQLASPSLRDDGVIKPILQVEEDAELEIRGVIGSVGLNGITEQRFGPFEIGLGSIDQ